MIKRSFKFFIIISFVSLSANARPISYSGGTTLMQKNGPVKNSLHIHYSPTFKYSIGYKADYFREDKIALNGIQLNYLVNRVNKKGSQGNIYLKSALGDANQSGKNELYGFLGFAADFETRKYFISYENSYYKSKQIISNFEQNIRLGIAPYVANYGHLHSWLMVEFKYNAENENDKMIVTPLIRLFKGPYLGEIGVSSNKKLLFNYFIRF
ncbi:MAG: hypothetical protein ISQ32_04575 [Rickettsiales bacterium]|nr:hypothetical protein [Rickettsiales bacterium]